jgi:hypothetical protein
LNNPEKRATIRAARADIRVLLRSRKPNKLFHEWHVRVIGALSNAFGPNSDECLEFLKINFEMAPQAKRSFHNRMENTLRDQGFRLRAPSFNATEYYRRGMHEADELLQTCELKLA